MGICFLLAIQLANCRPGGNRLLSRPRPMMDPNFEEKRDLAVFAQSNNEFAQRELRPEFNMNSRELRPEFNMMKRELKPEFNMMKRELKPEFTMDMKRELKPELS